MIGLDLSPAVKTKKGDDEVFASVCLFVSHVIRIFHEPLGHFYKIC